jgi:MFS family permease
LLVYRAIDGIAFSAPITLVGGTLSDLWPNEERNVPMAAFGAAPLVGPAVGPLVGGFPSDAAGWRRLYWIQLIVVAARLRKEENGPSHTTEKELDPLSKGEMAEITLLRPFQLLFLEPIVFFLALYMSVLYGFLYTFFVAEVAVGQPRSKVSLLISQFSRRLPKWQRLVGRHDRSDIHPARPQYRRQCILCPPLSTNTT